MLAVHNGRLLGQQKQQKVSLAWDWPGPDVTHKAHRTVPDVTQRTQNVPWELWLHFSVHTAQGRNPRPFKQACKEHSIHLHSVMQIVQRKNKSLLSSTEKKRKIIIFIFWNYMCYLPNRNFLNSLSSSWSPLMKRIVSQTMKLVSQATLGLLLVTWVPKVRAKPGDQGQSLPASANHILIDWEWHSVADQSWKWVRSVPLLARFFSKI